jgi:hypothetical protein
MKIITSNRSYQIQPLNTNAQGTQVMYQMTVIADMDASDTAQVDVFMQGEASKVVDINGSAVGLTYFAGALLA